MCLGIGKSRSVRELGTSRSHQTCLTGNSREQSRLAAAVEADKAIAATVVELEHRVDDERDTIVRHREADDLQISAAETCYDLNTNAHIVNADLVTWEAMAPVVLRAAAAALTKSSRVSFWEADTAVDFEAAGFGVAALATDSMEE